MTPALSRYLTLLTTLSLLSHVVVGGDTKVQSCTKAEIDTLLLNDNVRNCAASYTNLLPNKGCEAGLADQACYCHSPEFMAAVTGCLFDEEPDVQEELLRCGKWYLCDSLAARLNSSSVELTPESKDLLAKGKQASSMTSDTAGPSLLATISAWPALATVFAAIGLMSIV